MDHAEATYGSLGVRLQNSGEAVLIAASNRHGTGGTNCRIRMTEEFCYKKRYSYIRDKYGHQFPWTYKSLIMLPGCYRGTEDLPQLLSNII